MPYCVGEHETGYKDQTDNFQEVPVTPGICNQLPSLFMYEDQCLEEVIDKHRDGGAFAQTQDNFLVMTVVLSIVMGAE